ncbi:MAG: hypothetical protein IT539_03125 [Bradyrhizobiaceae bacterium]|nr:hypothetical protein [Bradyrhizobiaceae bacterium]
MHGNVIVPLRVLFALTAAALTAACVNNQDVTGSTANRTAFAQTIQSPVPTRELNPPPSAVEIRAQCWMHHDRMTADLDTKTALVKKCVADRTGL